MKKLALLLGMLALAAFSVDPAQARRGHGYGRGGKISLGGLSHGFRRGGRPVSLAPLLLPLPAEPPAQRRTFAPHDVAHAGPRLGIKFYENGLRVAYVDPGSPALRAGVSANDVLRSAGGRAVATHGDFAAAINAAVASGRLRISLLRAGKIRSVTIALR